MPPMGCSGTIMAPLQLIILAKRFGEMVFIQVIFTDPGANDTHSSIINWGDDTTDAGLLTEPVADQGTVAGNHLYTWPGDYVIDVQVIDNSGGIGQDTLQVKVLPVVSVMIQTLADKADNLNVTKSTKGKCQSNTLSLDTAVKVLNDSNPKNDTAAINTLKAFINNLRALSGKKVPPATVDELVSMAEEIITILNESLPKPSYKDYNWKGRYTFYNPYWWKYNSWYPSWSDWGYSNYHWY